MSSSNLSDTPLLSSGEEDSRRRTLRRQSLRQAARFLRQASSRRMMRESSMLVREAAAEQLEERQTDWAYSKPVVILDLLWNIAFIAAAIAVMVLSWNERPGFPLRLWIVGYALQCVLHMVCVSLEYRKRRHRRWRTPDEAFSSGSGDSSTGYVTLAHFQERGTSNVAKHLESANTMFSFVWWIIGFYWVSDGGQQLVKDSPLLYWLCIVYLAFDVFFVVFCVALACLIGIAVCCCLPCIIALLYAVADQEGATKEEIEQLAKYKFQWVGNAEKINDEIPEPSGGVMIECGTDTPDERHLSTEDAECCICLSAYEDGTELRELPCGHHFHCSCVDKWLYINATCPLCKYNIMRSSSHRSSEEA